MNHARRYVSKEDFATALCAHKAALDATKSPQRDAAEIWRGRSPIPVANKKQNKSEEVE